jgi:hypothetical protein
MTDETPWNLPTKENIVSQPYEVLRLPLYVIQLREMMTLVRDAQPHDSFFLYCT